MIQLPCSLSKVVVGGVIYRLGYNDRMKTKPLTFLLALTFLFLFSGSVYGQEEVNKKIKFLEIESQEIDAGEERRLLNEDIMRERSSGGTNV